MGRCSLFPKHNSSIAMVSRGLIRRLGVAAALAVLLMPQAARSGTDVCGHPARGQVTIERGGQVLAVFTVAEAVSIARRQRGLMNCPALEPGSGLLFIYADARPRVFWMKDTPLELAIIFVAADGRIAAIERGIPRSLTRISSPGPVQYVLEINYDEAGSLQVGDRILRVAPAPALQPQ